MTVTSTHVHDCTGPDMTCHCGWKFSVPRFAVTIEVYDNQTKQSLINECFMTDDVTAASYALDAAVTKLDAF